MGQGPEDQLAELYATACPRLVGYLTVLIGNPADAEEVAQETFVQALRHWRRIRAYDDPTAWLYRVATRLAISRGRRSQVARRGLVRLQAGVREHDTSGGGDDNLDLDLDLDLDQAMASLTPEHRAVLLLHHLHDLSVAEVARVLDLAEGTVKSRLARARAALMPLLDDPRRIS
ncbi:MAG: sigma-70 family RNA polymerase sigma factor [Actinobacteria bacterium]|nr:sigma-70 family RNA polymerase sigma factor [Actinomycetota bacterium]